MTEGWIAEDRSAEDRSAEEPWFRGAVAASRNGIVITDANGVDNPIVYANPAFERMTGYSLEEILGRNCRFLQGPDHAQSALEELRAAVEAGRDCKVVLRNYRKNGTPFWNELSISPVRDEEGRLLNFVGVLDDITERTRTGEALRRSEEMLRRDGERLSSIIAIQQEIATAKLDLDAVMELVADRMRALTGADGAAVEMVEGDELVYRAASGSVASHIELRLKVDSSLSGRCVRSGELMYSEDTGNDERVDVEACRRIGASSMIVVPLVHHRKTVGVLKVLSSRTHAFGERDMDTVRLMTGLIAAGMSQTAEFEAERALVKERTAALAKIRKSEEHFRGIFDQSITGIAETDLAGRFVLVNDRYCEITGYTREELLDLRIKDITHPDDWPRNEELLERLAEEGKGFTIEKRYVREDGAPVWVTNAVSPLRDGSGRPVSALAVCEDITERKRAEEALLEIREAERRRIARDLHDAVLQDISGALQSLQALQLEARDLRGDVVRPALDALRRASGGLRGAIYDLRESGEQPFAREVESLVELNRQMVPERDLTLRVGEGFPEYLPEMVSPEMLRIAHEALANVRRHSRSRRACVTLGSDSNAVRVSVSDDGRGFDPEKTPEGLGISGMRERALAVGGKLEVSSAPGEGTTVTARVPLGEVLGG